MSIILRLTDTRRIAFPSNGNTCPAANAGHDDNGVPLTKRAQWIVSLFACGALERECDHLLSPTVDPQSGEVVQPDVPSRACAGCGAPFPRYGRAAHALLCPGCRGYRPSRAKASPRTRTQAL